VTNRRRRTTGGTNPTLYARALRLKHIHPGGLACFLMFEGAIALAGLMALAEFVTWLAVILLPLVVAIVVKINDLVAGVFSRTGRSRRGKTVVLRPVIWARGVASVPSPPGAPPLETVDAGVLPVRQASAVYGVSQARRKDGESMDAVRPQTRRHASNQRRFVSTTRVRPADRVG